MKYLAITDGTRSVVAQYQSDNREEVEAWILENGPATLYAVVAEVEQVTKRHLDAIGDLTRKYRINGAAKGYLREAVEAIYAADSAATRLCEG